jgi:glycosyltransferase involved in cell wall biosynthesis
MRIGEMAEPLLPLRPSGADRRREAAIPFVSIIVPVYNGQQTIAACIESLLAQEYPRERYEILVVDNNSTDRTAEIVQQYPVTLLHEQGVQTPAAARNRGIQAARGEILALLDADCIAVPAWMRFLVSGLSEPGVGAVSGPIEATQPRTLVEQFFAEQNPLLVHDRGPFVSLLTCNMACDRALVEQLGSFDERLPTIEDLDLGWRIQSTAKKQIVYAPGALVYHQYRSSVRGLFHAYRRYGLSEILVDTLYRGQEFAPRTPRQQLVKMLRQVGALITYVLSFLRRCVTWPIRRHSRKEMRWPLLWLVAESGDLLGKIQGLIATRFFQRNPFSSQPEGKPAQSAALYRR